MNINTMTINVKKSTVTELNGNVPGNSTTTTTTKVVRDRAVTAPLPSPPPTVVVTMEQPPKTLPHTQSQSLLKAESERSRSSEVRDAEKEVSVTKAAEEEAARGEPSPLDEKKSEPAVINAPKPIIEEDDDDGGESDPESPPPVHRHSPLKKTSGISQSNGGGGRSNGVLLHKDSNAADFVDSLVNNKNRINAHNLVGDTSNVTTMTAAVSLADTATSTSPPPMKKSQSSSTTTSSSGPGSNPNYWANQVSLQYENAQNTIEVQKACLGEILLLGLPELSLVALHLLILMLPLSSCLFI